jgi:hypothetical protein
VLYIHVSNLTVENAPSITLTSGLNVVNFSSPHPFNFESGQVLEACSAERSKALSMGSDDVITSTTLPNGKVMDVVTKKFTLTDTVRQELDILQDDDNIDVILVPFPTLQCLQASGEIEKLTKVATIFVVDRVSKAISVSKFCR